MASAAAVMRKTVTVLFCDLAESTRLGERLDPETLRSVMSRWFDAMRTPVERAGGTVEKFVGDAVMAVFGIPAAHEDDAFRAVQAAVEMRDAAAALDLRVRIGVNTGEVVTGDGSTTLVTGDAVNTAKRLEEAAAPGEILVGAATRRLVENATHLEPVGGVDAKGKRDPVDAWRVLATIPGATPFARRLDAPLVGRRRELALLEEELAAAARDRACRLVTVLGPAGVGKSRLAQELLARVDARVITARCVPYGDGITFLPLRDLVGDIAGESNDEIFWEVRRLLEEQARERPLVVCLEDVHWAEPAFLDLIEYLVGWSRDAPILLLCLARPELHDARPRWPGAAFALEALNADESAQLLDELAAEWPVAPEARKQIEEAAEGNPLFLEQLVAMVAEHGGNSAIPPTIHALLDARLDRLDPEERSVLGRAAVAGRDFSRDAVAELSGDDVGATLLSLARKELVRPDHSGTSSEDRFRFRHALIRDAAYGAIPKSTRAELHERFAAWLERRDAEEELVGYHLEQAVHFHAELGIAAPALAERAGVLLAAAGERAFARDDGSAASNLLLRAHALLAPDDPRQLRVLRRAGLALWWGGSVDTARALLTEQIERAAALGDRVEEWSGRLDLAAGDLIIGRNDADGLLAVAEKAIEAFDPSDDAGLARAWRRVAHAHSVKGRYADAVVAAERALAHARDGSERFEETRIVDLLGTSLLYGPTPAGDAAARCREMLALAGESDVMHANVAAPLVGLLGMQGEFAAAREYARRAAEIYLDFGLTLAFAGLTQVTGPMELLAGDPAAAERELVRGLEILEPRNGDGYQQALLAEAVYRQGRLDEAAERARLAEERSPADLILAQVAWRGVRAKLDGSEETAREGVALARTTDSTNLVGDALADLGAVLAERGDGRADETIRAALDAYADKGNVAAARALENRRASAIRSVDPQ